MNLESVAVSRLVREAAERAGLIRKAEEMLTATQRVHDQLCQARGARRGCVELDGRRAGAE